MSITFPDGAVTGEWPDSDSEVEVTSEANAAVLLAIAGTYHSAQYMLAVRTQRLTRDLWSRLRPVDDASLGQWMGAWDSALSSAAAAQNRLTESYVRMSLQSFGVRTPPMVTVQPPGESRIANVEAWLDSDVADLDPNLHDEAEALLRRLRGQQASLNDLARADRLPWLHSPVVKGRTNLSNGMGLDDALAAVEPSLDVVVDAALRTNESDVIGNVGWPRFKNGKAMLAKRLPSAGACGWCRVVATRLYSLESYTRDKAWHADCRCDMVLVTEAEAKRYASVFQSTKGEGGRAGSDEGNYYKAAQAIGLWSGPTERGAFNDIIDQRAKPSPGAEGSQG